MAVQRAATAVRVAMSAADRAERLAVFGLDVTVNTPADLSQAVKDESTGALS